ncbi:MAG: putative portal protein [Prokaryotic dsDNA virus sp.]|nr:MAG: putative portal protein [Prokaryotic dsDNA virus sp.]|tara:strand:+ start:10268 stop:12376 length:2109 start_codon:yes stop_codon:yes gene_type:complete
MDKILNINLETQTAPKVIENISKDWIEYGTENWANLYPQFLIDLYYNSSTHAAIINATSDMIAGEGIMIDENDNVDADAKLRRFLAQANSNETLHEVIKKLAFDYKLQGGFAINIIWNQTRTEIAEIYHVPVERIRAGKPNKLGRVEYYYVCSDWSNTRKNKPHKVPAFNMNDRTSPSQIMYSGTYSPNMDIYYTPDYTAACNWALIDQRVAEFHLSNIENGFSGSYFISFANGIPTEQERFQIENSIKNKFTGAKASGKFVLTFSDDQTKTPTITPIAVANADKQYLALQELLVQNILTGHRVTSPMLMGIKNDTGLGNNADELNSAFEVYLNTVVKPYQNTILKCISKILDVNNIALPIEFIQNKPITSKFTLEDMKEVMTTDEIREELGLPPLEAGQEQEFAKVGSIVTDNIELPLFDTIEEAEAEAERIGCEGHHIHTQDGKEYYMPCKDHDTIKDLDLGECNCKEEMISPNPCQSGYEPIGHKIKDGRKVPNCVPIQASELDKFLATHGEEIDENEWTLVADTKVDDEHEDFDFEHELNDIARYEFKTTTGTARPSSRSEQDGIDRDFNLYKVRYEYAAGRNPGNGREFCKKMMAAGKVYRKEDILMMGSIPVNPGFGPRGADTYSIWFYKGGKNCSHFWRRKIYFYKLGVATGTKITDATDIVGTVEARSRGFRPKANDKKVSRIPYNMPNRGGLN